eukprot:TRINITY_DN9528_c0_g1_i1.p1 TRINITY_DN9528_c0_g1~~TRINITY_DN9528_c0_g1_i1.p1  ORF type:complete len:442 (-),score=84.26 TRINITY_DN9528_c0_g1_i1:77-1402(-)
MAYVSGFTRILCLVLMKSVFASVCGGSECEEDANSLKLLQHSSIVVANTFWATARKMRENPLDVVIQLAGCAKLAVDSSKKSEQDAAARAGVIDVIAAAQANHPDSREVQEACTQAMASIILFNRENGLRAGRLGGLNHTLAAYKRWMDDPVPTVTLLGGSIGAYFDFVDENRLIARELGGIQMILQNIKNNFHGKLGEWNYDPVKQSVFAMSSGTKFNEDVCVQMGCVQLYVQLMQEHGHEAKIAEEIMQSLRWIMSTRNPRGQEDRSSFLEAGGPAAVAHVMKVNPHDQGALDLACITASYMVGPHMSDGNIALPFDQAAQLELTEAGLVQLTLDILTGSKQLQQLEHQMFNFDTDLAYNYRRDCYKLLTNLAHDNSQNKELILGAGVDKQVLGRLAEQPTDPLEVVAGCELLSILEVHNDACSIKAVVDTVASAVQAR